MNEKYYKYSTFVLIISGIIALSYFDNQDAINLFSIVAAVVSIILGVYSLFTSESKNNETNAVFRKLELLNNKIDMKLDNLKDEVKNIKVMNSDNKVEEIITYQGETYQYVSHTDFDSEVELDEEEIKQQINKGLNAYYSEMKIDFVKVLSKSKNIKSATILVIGKGRINEDIFEKIIGEAIMHSTKQSNSTQTNENKKIYSTRSESRTLTIKI